MNYWLVHMWLEKNRTYYGLAEGCTVNICILQKNRPIHMIWILYNAVRIFVKINLVFPNAIKSQKTLLKNQIKLEY